VVESETVTPGDDVKVVVDSFGDAVTIFICLFCKFFGFLLNLISTFSLKGCYLRQQHLCHSLIRPLQLELHTVISI
jgi:hypothetical protein